jgi:hypothetical protein
LGGLAWLLGTVLGIVSMTKPHPEHKRMGWLALFMCVLALFTLGIMLPLFAHC